jgi:hypothetical protein
MIVVVSVNVVAAPVVVIVGRVLAGWQPWAGSRTFALEGFEALGRTAQGRKGLGPARIKVGIRVVGLPAVLALSRHRKARKVGSGVDNDRLALRDGRSHPQVDVVGSVSLGEGNALVSIELATDEGFEEFATVLVITLTTILFFCSFLRVDCPIFAIVSSSDRCGVGKDAPQYLPPENVRFVEL